MNKGRRLGILGCGAIGSQVALALRSKRSSFRVTALFDREPSRCQGLRRELHPHPRACRTFPEFLSRCDIVLEAASANAVLPLARAALRRQKPLVLMSVGGFLANKAELTRLASRYRTKVYLPSGALAGLDALKAARQGGGIRRMTLTTTKPPRGFEGAPGLTQGQKRSLYKRKSAFYLYQGDVAGAVKRFPANVNVSATASLAAGAPRGFEVRIRSDRKARRNTHELSIRGIFGEMTTITRNRPSSKNPRTSVLAVLSALALFERLETFIEVGS